MSAASISLAIGTTAAANVTDGATTFVPPGSLVTIALQSSTGIKNWQVRAENPLQGAEPDNSLGGFVYVCTSGQTFSTSLTLPRNTGIYRFVSETLDSNNNVVTAKFQIAAYQEMGKQHLRAAVVNTSNVNTAAMNVVIDGQTLTQGETVLLVAQTTGAENGLYTCGSVASNLSALTRSAMLPAGEIIPSPCIVEIEKGTTYGGTTWKTSNTGSLTVATTSLTFYPRTIRAAAAALSGGTLNVNSQFIQSGACAVATCNNATNTMRARTPVAGAGTGYVVFDGTTSDTFNYVIINWG